MIGQLMFDPATESMALTTNIWITGICGHLRFRSFGRRSGSLIDSVQIYPMGLTDILVYVDGVNN